MKKILSFTIVVFLLLGSFVAGSRYGVESFIQSDAKYQASLATYKLQVLGKNNLEYLRTSLEFDRDYSLILHGRGQSNIFLALWPDLNSGENIQSGLKALTHASTYRKSNPTSPMSTEQLEKFDQVTRQEVIADQEMLEAVTSEYAK
jgi:hypothetical protein